MKTQERIQHEHDFYQNVVKQQESFLTHREVTEEHKESLGKNKSYLEALKWVLNKQDSKPFREGKKYFVKFTIDTDEDSVFECILTLVIEDIIQVRNAVREYFNHTSPSIKLSENDKITIREIKEL